MDEELKKYREVIDKIDSEMLNLFLKRFSCVNNILKYKIEHSLNVEDLKREKEHINNMLLKIKEENLKQYYVTFLQNIMELSKKYQEDILRGNS